MNHYKGFKTCLRIEKGRAESTLEAYMGDIERFERWLQDHLGTPIDWQEVATKHVRSYLTDLDASPHYYHRVHSSLSSWFNYLINVAEVYMANPVAQVAKPKLGSRLPKHLNMAELERLIHTAAAESRSSNRVRNWTMCAFLAGTGLRVTEFVSMNISDIRHQEGHPHTVTVIGKGNKQRQVVLTEAAKTALYQWLRERKALIRNYPLDIDGEAVWVNPAGGYRGKRMTRQAAGRVIRKMGKLTDLTIGLHPHVLRHTTGTELARNKASLHAIRDTLGHSNLSTTSIYLHADQEELEAMAASMPDFLAGGKRARRDRLPGEQALFEEAQDEA